MQEQAGRLIKRTHSDPININVIKLPFLVLDDGLINDNMMQFLKKEG